MDLPFLLHTYDLTLPCDSILCSPQLTCFRHRVLRHEISYPRYIDKMLIIKIFGNTVMSPGAASKVLVEPGRYNSCRQQRWQKSD